LLGLCFWVAAIFLWIVAGAVIVTYGHYDKFTESHYTLIPAVIIIVVGVFFFFAGILGCCSMFNMNKCVLILFGFILFVLMTLLIVAAALTVVNRKEIEGSIHNDTSRMINNYTGIEGDAWTDQIDYIQKNLKCCGVDDYKDWITTPWGIKNLLKVPGSCCNVTSTLCTGSEPVVIPSQLISGTIYTDGCYQKVSDTLNGNLRCIAIVVAILLSILLIGLICSCVLLCIKKREEQPYYALTPN